MKNNRFFAIIIIGVVLAFCSCSPAAVVTLKESGDVAVQLSVIPTETMETLVKNLDDSNSATLFDANSIKSNLASERISVENLNFVSYAGVNASFTVPKSRIAQSQLFKIDTANKKITCNINKASMAALIDTFPQEITDYLEYFISPITTGEDLSAQEYEQLITASYGPKIANELKTSYFKITLNCPGVVESVKTEPTGNVRHFSGNSVVITIPLSEIMSLQKPLLVTINYK